MRPVSLRESANSSTPPVTRPRGLSGCGATWSTRTRSLGGTGRVVMGVAVATPTSVAAVTDLLPFRRRVRSPAALPSRPAMVVSFVGLQSDGQTPLAPLAPMGVSAIWCRCCRGNTLESHPERGDRGQAESLVDCGHTFRADDVLSAQATLRARPGPGGASSGMLPDWLGVAVATPSKRALCLGRLDGFSPLAAMVPICTAHSLVNRCCGAFGDAESLQVKLSGAGRTWMIAMGERV